MTLFGQPIHVAPDAVFIMPGTRKVAFFCFLGAEVGFGGSVEVPVR